MKYSKFKLYLSFRLKYTKVLCLKSIFILLIASCGYGNSNPNLADTTINSSTEIIVGASRMAAYLPFLENKVVGLTGNQSSLVGTSHLVDTLLQYGINLSKVFSPEHGFRGDADAGEKVSSKIDEKTGIQIVSLYGSNKKPTSEQLKGIEIMIFDIQDVGVRFYTYISTLHYVMEACAELKIPVLILDRPNPNGHYVDGPIREPEFKSFVGMHPVPIVHGMTIGEYGQLIKGEKWIRFADQCELKVISCLNYTHDTPYSLPVAPSPNLRSDLAIQLYPSLCLLEGTSVTVGRGTEGPFERYGHPAFTGGDFRFTPTPGYGSKNPKHEGVECRGVNLADSSITRMNELDLSFLIHANELLEGKLFDDKKKIFNLLAGNDTLWRQIKDGKSIDEIKSSWEPGLSQFKEKRKKYVIYK